LTRTTGTPHLHPPLAILLMGFKFKTSKNRQKRKETKKREEENRKEKKRINTNKG
jgi:hypothetical protein